MNTDSSPSPIELARRALAMDGLTTPGPWISNPRDNPNVTHARVTSRVLASSGIPGEAGSSEMEASLYWPVHPQNPTAEAAAVEKTYCNADFIAFARDALPALARAVIEAETPCFKGAILTCAIDWYASGRTFEAWIEHARYRHGSAKKEEDTRTATQIIAEHRSSAAPEAGKDAE